LKAIGYYLNVQLLSYMRVHLLTIAIALLFAVLAMRGALDSDITYNDQARHAMNGVVLHDLVRDKAWGSPIAYYMKYFARYPSLSMPYHPPLFPAVEALFFTIFGISQFTARLTVASFVFGVGILLFRLVLGTHKSAAFAASATVVFLSIPLTQQLSADVMLEIPALFFALGSLICIQRCETGWSTPRAVAAGLLCFAAIWVKQCIFLALVPALIAIGHRRWKLLVTPPYLIHAAICTAAAGSLGWLWYRAGLTSVGRHWGSNGLLSSVAHSITYYSAFLLRPSVVIALLAAAAIAGLAARNGWWPAVRKGFHPLYVAWIVSVLAVLLVVPARDVRYLWFVFAPVVVLCLSWFHALELGRWLSRPWLTPVLAGVAFAVSAATPLPHLTGPSAVARELLKYRPNRVLVAAASNGSIIFALRSLCSTCETVVIRADKLPAESFQPSKFDDMAHRLGVEMIVIEKARSSEAWTYLLQWPSKHMQLHTVIPQESTGYGWDGELMIYRYLNPSPLPEPLLTIPVRSSGQSVNLEF
jgi:4-amino-4-deoxy-L-arabinose transferase-like glycosyltransferase